MATYSPSGSGNVHTDTALRNVSVGYPQGSKKVVGKAVKKTVSKKVAAKKVAKRIVPKKTTSKKAGK